MDMRKECQCGCGMKLTFVDRRIAKRAATIKGQVKFLRETTLPAYAETHSAEDVQELRDFIRDGHRIGTALYGEAHGGAGQTTSQRLAGPPRHRQVNAWCKAASGMLKATDAGTAGL